MRLDKTKKVEGFIIYDKLWGIVLLDKHWRCNISFLLFI